MHRLSIDFLLTTCVGTWVTCMIESSGAYCIQVHQFLKVARLFLGLNHLITPIPRSSFHDQQFTKNFNKLDRAFFFNKKHDENVGSS